MTEKYYDDCRQLNIFDFLPGNEVGDKPFSGSSGENPGKLKIKTPKSSRAEKCPEQVTEYLKEGTPFESPPPKINYADKCFCLTGKFGFGSQAKVSGIIVGLGGSVQKNVTDRTDYLIVGERANKNWINGSYGLKIQIATSRKLEGRDISLIKEEDFIVTFPEKMNPSRRQMRFEDYLGGW